jgi:hypothetical protein
MVFFCYFSLKIKELRFVFSIISAISPIQPCDNNGNTDDADWADIHGFQIEKSVLIREIRLIRTPIMLIFNLIKRVITQNLALPVFISPFH